MFRQKSQQTKNQQQQVQQKEQEKQQEKAHEQQAKEQESQAQLSKKVIFEERPDLDWLFAPEILAHCNTDDRVHSVLSFNFLPFFSQLAKEFESDLNPARLSKLGLYYLSKDIDVTILDRLIQTYYSAVLDHLENPTNHSETMIDVEWKNIAHVVKNNKCTFNQVVCVELMIEKILTRINWQSEAEQLIEKVNIDLSNSKFAINKFLSKISRFYGVTLQETDLFATDVNKKSIALRWDAGYQFYWALFNGYCQENYFDTKYLFRDVDNGVSFVSYINDTVLNPTLRIRSLKLWSYELNDNGIKKAIPFLPWYVEQLAANVNCHADYLQKFHFKMEHIFEIWLAFIAYIKTQAIKNNADYLREFTLTFWEESAKALRGDKSITRTISLNAEAMRAMLAVFGKERKTNVITERQLVTVFCNLMIPERMKISFIKLLGADFLDEFLKQPLAEENAIGIIYYYLSVHPNANIIDVLSSIHYKNAQLALMGWVGVEPKDLLYQDWKAKFSRWLNASDEKTLCDNIIFIVKKYLSSLSPNDVDLFISKLFNDMFAKSSLENLELLFKLLLKLNKPDFDLTKVIPKCYPENIENYLKFMKRLATINPKDKLVKLKTNYLILLKNADLLECGIAKNIDELVSVLEQTDEDNQKNIIKKTTLTKHAKSPKELGKLAAFVGKSDHEIKEEIQDQSITACETVLRNAFKKGASDKHMDQESQAMFACDALNRGYIEKLLKLSPSEIRSLHPNIDNAISSHIPGQYSSIANIPDIKAIFNFLRFYDKEKQRIFAVIKDHLFSVKLPFITMLLSVIVLDCDSLITLITKMVGIIRAITEEIHTSNVPIENRQAFIAKYIKELNSNLKHVTSLNDDIDKKAIKAKVDEVEHELDNLVHDIMNELFPEKSLDEIRAGFLTPSDDVKFHLSASEIDNVIERYKALLRHCHSYLLMQPEIVTNDLAKREIHQSNDLKLLAAIRIQYKISFGYYPTNLQMINILALLRTKNNKCLAQIKTGEGKSTLTAIMAAYWIYNKKNVYVITTSPDLANKDYEATKYFFRSIRMSSVILNAANYGESRVLFVNYVPYSELQFGQIEDKRSRIDLTKVTPHNVAIYDEFDGSRLDDLNSAKLADTAENKVPAELYQLIWNTFHDKDIPSDLEPFFTLVSKHLKVNVCDEIVPNQLSEQPILLKSKIMRLVNSVKYAKKKVLNKHYVLHQNEKKIVIVDYKNTGKLLFEQQWRDGIYQLIQAKHQLPITVELNLINEINIVHLINEMFPGYFYGLSGTLGSSIERAELGISNYDSPTYHPKKQTKELPIITKTDEAYYISLKEKVADTIKAGRSILILCETILECEVLEKLLASQKPLLYTGVQQQSEQDIRDHLARQQAVLIATNIAGRGMDLRLPGSVIQNGGLVVAMTFLPINSRVRDQNHGRSSRQGQPGSIIYILKLATLTARLKKLDLFINSDDPIKLFQHWEENLDKSFLNHFITKNRHAKFEHKFLNIIQTFYYDIKSDSVDAVWEKQYPIFSTYIKRLSQKPLTEIEKIARARKKFMQFYRELMAIPYGKKPDEINTSQKIQKALHDEMYGLVEMLLSDGDNLSNYLQNNHSLDHIANLASKFPTAFTAPLKSSKKHSRRKKIYIENSANEIRIILAENGIVATEVNRLVDLYADLDVEQNKLFSLTTELLYRSLKSHLSEIKEVAELNITVLAHVIEIFRRTFGVAPTRIEVMNLLILITQPNKNVLANAHLHERKSVIIAVLAAYFILQKPKQSTLFVIVPTQKQAEACKNQFKLFFINLAIASHVATNAANIDVKQSILFGTLKEFYDLQSNYQYYIEPHTTIIYHFDNLINTLTDPTANAAHRQYFSDFAKCYAFSSRKYKEEVKEFFQAKLQYHSQALLAHASCDNSASSNINPNLKNLVKEQIEKQNNVIVMVKEKDIAAAYNVSDLLASDYKVFNSLKCDGFYDHISYNIFITDTAPTFKEDWWDENNKDKYIIIDAASPELEVNDVRKLLETKREEVNVANNPASIFWNNSQEDSANASANKHEFRVQQN